MLHVFFGDDAVTVRKKALDRFHAEEGGASNIVTAETYAPGMLAELAGSSPLFSGKQTILLDMLSERGAEVLEDVMGGLPLLQGSENVFVIIEGPLTAAQKKKLEKHAEKVVEVKREKEERFNAFRMTDAFLKRDKRSLWLLLEEAWSEGLTHEEIIGVLFWQLKTVRLAGKSKSANEAGLKPFVYEKAKRARFTEAELRELSRGLLAVYHDGHLGKVDTGHALEKWVLSL